MSYLVEISKPDLELLISVLRSGCILDAQELLETLEGVLSAPEDGVIHMVSDI